MSASDGTVLTTTKVVDHGPDTARWNLVVIGDGYQASEITQYHTDVQNFLTVFRTTPPFDTLFGGVNVYRIDVASNESGADIPACAGGTPVTKNTYFDATFCSLFSGSPLERLLTINESLAFSVVNARVPLKHQVLCIVNSSKYGGSGGSIATCSTDPSSASIAIHEIGHSAFGLADEYGGDGSATPAGEFTEPNVTRNTNRATIKWGSLIAASTPLPSACDGSCTSSTCVPPGTPPAPGAVGAYEGGKYADCNTYRPLPSCYMRDYGPFCPVCAGVIRQVLQPFQPAETINLLTPSISFTNVPAGMGGMGVTTFRAIVWEVVTSRTIHFEITSGPSGGFGTPNGPATSVTADPVLPQAYARLWISYTSTNPGDTANGVVNVRCVETGQTWPINITANTIARPKSAVSLVLDRSYSMTEDAGDAVTKIAKLREAANAFISIMLPNDGIGLVRFNQAAQRLMEITDVNTGRTTAINHISGSDIDPAGNTSIGDGVVKGKQMLDDGQAAATTPYDVTAMVVLTDGMWNTPPALSAVTGSITANTYAVGLGIPSNISVPALTSLCQGHNGYMLITGAISSDQSMRLSKYFLQILAGITNAQIISDPRGVLSVNAEHRIPFYICEADYGMDLVVLSPLPQIIDFQLEAPDGTRITPASGGNAHFVMSRYASYYRCALPVLPGNEKGTREGLWYAVLKLGRVPSGHLTHVPDNFGALSSQYKNGIPYEFVAHAYSSLVFKAHLTQSSFEMNAGAMITAAILEYDAPLAGSATAWVEITRPDGSADVRSLDKLPDSRFSLNYNLNMYGVFVFRVRARGETMHGIPFEREQTFTAVATPGGDKWDPNDGSKDDDLCELLHCLEKNGVLNERFLERMKELGIDFASFWKCLREKCRKKHYVIEERTPVKQIPGVPVNVNDDQLDRLIELIAARMKKI